jgi:hypothetical protein
VREIHQVHDPEHERQARGHQEQHDAELQPVERLLQDQDEIHGREIKKGRGQSAPLALAALGYHFILHSFSYESL